MAIKSDRWIRRMAQEHGMISPFEPDQVRHTAAGKVISFGTSSYGYDVRCSEEFKIFTNVHSATVDPKNFDPKSFVDITAGDIDWASVRAALKEIGFTGWVSAEVGGGDTARLKTVLDQMKKALIG